MERISIKDKSFSKTSFNLISDKSNNLPVEIKKVSRNTLLGFFLSLINVSTKVNYNDKKNEKHTIYVGINSLLSHILESANQNNDKKSVDNFKKQLKNKKFDLSNVDGEKLRLIFNESRNLTPNNTFDHDKSLDPDSLPLQVRAKVAAKGEEFKEPFNTVRYYTKLHSLLLGAETKDIPVILTEAAKNSEGMQSVIDKTMELPENNHTVIAIKEWLQKEPGQKAFSEVLDRLSQLSGEGLNQQYEFKTDLDIQEGSFLKRLLMNKEKLSLSDAVIARTEKLLNYFQETDEKTKDLPRFMNE